MSDTLEAQVKALQKQVKNLQKQVTTLKDIEDIKKVEKAYGYYLEHILYNEVADLWTDDGYMEWTGIGRFIGKEAIRKQWKAVKDGFFKHNPPEYMHMAPQIMGYVTVDPDGKTGYGRWYVAGGQYGASFLYENTYRKENGLWKMHIMRCGGFPRAPSTLGGAGGDSPGGKSQAPVDEVEREKMTQGYMSQYDFTERISRIPRQEWEPWVRPFHFKHPVTGKDINQTSVKAHNDSYPVTMPPGGEKWMAPKTK